LRRAVGVEAFEAYAARTPRWLPTFRLFSTPPSYAFQTKALRKEALRAGRLLAAGIALTLAAAARYEPWWPQWFNLP
jgi:hypothetical protein